MRTKSRDKENVYISNRISNIAEVDDNGNETGTTIPQYSAPTLYSLRVENLTEDAEIALWGADSRMMKKITETADVLGSDDVYFLDAVWIDRTPTESYDSDAPHGKNLINPLLFSNGELLNVATGTLTTNTSYSTTDFISVLAGETYVLSHYYNLSVCNVCFYDSDSGFVSGSVVSAADHTTVPYLITAPTGASFMRLSANNISGTPVAYWQIELGAIPTYYEGYCETVQPTGSNYIVATKPITTPRFIVVYLKSVAEDG